MSSPLVTEFELQQPRYAGLRLTADEFFELEDDGFRYELIDGVMVMTSCVVTETGRCPLYAGLRLSAEEYFELEDDGFRYELINGVMVMSPSPMPLHQGVLVELITQLNVFLRQDAMGRVYPDVDVKLVKGLIYRPDLVFIRKERLPKPLKRIDIVPDLVVEIISPSSRLLDRREKKQDYERYGVQEYWVIDPEAETFTFYGREGESFVELESGSEQFASRAVPGFILNLAALRATFRSV